MSDSERAQRVDNLRRACAIVAYNATEQARGKNGTPAKEHTVLEGLLKILIGEQPTAEEMKLVKSY